MSLSRYLCTQLYVSSSVLSHFFISYITLLQACYIQIQQESTAQEQRGRRTLYIVRQATGKLHRVMAEGGHSIPLSSSVRQENNVSFIADSFVSYSLPKFWRVFCEEGSCHRKVTHRPLLDVLENCIIIFRTFDKSSPEIFRNIL